MNGHSTKKGGRRFIFSVFGIALSMLFGMFPTLPFPAAAQRQGDREMLIPGGAPFGVRFHTDGAVVYRVDPDSPAAAAGICPSDLILSVNSEKLKNAQDLAGYIKPGETLEIEYTRDGKRARTEVKIPQTEEKTQIGLYLRDSLAGIGTLSFIDPETGFFAGLGHGVCDALGGSLLPMAHGNIAKVRLTTLVPGQKGAPGQLRGLFYPGSIGEVTMNTPQGIFGRLNETPQEFEALPAALENEVCHGSAEILCTVDAGGVGRYAVEIERILGYDSNGKNFLIRVTDPGLLEISGGIVQGMSGSPIIQNGRIVGAVTHVLLEDPSRGYGIFIGNMLNRMREKR